MWPSVCALRHCCFRLSFTNWRFAKGHVFFCYCECQCLVRVVIALISNKLINKNSVVNLINKPFSHLSHEGKLEIKILGCPLPDLTIKQNIKSGTRTFCRTFKSDYYSKTDWLCGCDTKNALFCFPCLLFCGEQLWTKSGLTGINHLSERVEKHQASNVHIKNILQLALFGTVNIARCV